MSRKKTLREKLDNYVPEPNSGCWLWLGCTNQRGYGQIKVGGSGVGAHRVSYRVHRGPTPAGRFVCHRCDTPVCVNPAHLYVGGPVSNMRDASDRGRLWQQQVDECPRGHQYSEENTRICRRGYRHCRSCGRVRNHVRRGMSVDEAEKYERTHGARRSVRTLTFQGVERSLGEWAAEAGISERALRGRLERGWPMSTALSRGNSQRGPRVMPAAEP